MSCFRDGILAGRVALVTGGGTGIGKEIARTLGRHGAKLAIASRRREVLEAARAEFEAEGLENIPDEHENVLYCLNHSSIIDNFAFESVAYLPKLLVRPEYLPVNLADRKNFFGDPKSRRLKAA